MLIQSGGVDLVVIDSVAALVPKAEIEGEMGDTHVGLQARLMSQALRKLTGSINKSGTTVIFINQIREKIGVMCGSPETTSGGRALKFYSSVRIDVRRIETLKVGPEQIGNRVRAKIVKNKVAPHSINTMNSLPTLLTLKPRGRHSRPRCPRRRTSKPTLRPARSLIQETKSKKGASTISSEIISELSVT